MQFIKNGPDIPELLLQAHEDGRVVFFCGAGISYPGGLPGFSGLVNKVYSDVGATPNDVEQTALDGALYDTAISLLENRIVGNRSTVRAALAKVLTPDLSLPNATTTHEALITLSKTLKGQFRLITTNFDRLFIEARGRLKTEFDEFSAPLLPVPKKKWDGLVYLHGLLPEHPKSAELDRLVVSSGDFGLAYLTERWAARFVSELFRNYTICFVGYSLNDPVLRYMMDALAADRLLGEVPLEVFAFGNCARGQEDRVTNEWRAKNVTPILYHNYKTHAYLHGTLRAWAETYRDGTRGKEAIIARHANARPIGSTRQDDFVGRVLWAISDATGLPAKHFADFNPLPSLDWLSAFSQDRFRHRDLIRFGVRVNDIENPKLTYSLIERPAPYTHSPWMRLTWWSDWSRSNWDAVMTQIGRWLARHLANPKLLVWIAQRGGHLEERFEYLVSQALDSDPPHPLMESLWRLAIAGRLRDESRRLDLYDWNRRFLKTGLTPMLRLELRDILSPHVKVREGYQSEDDDHPQTEAERIKGAIDWELVLGSNFIHSALDSSTQKDGWQAALPSLLTDFTELLRDALDIMRQLGQTTSRSDRSHWHQPAIQSHSQNRRYHDWTALIELVRDAWIATAARSPDRARREALAWLEVEYPLFKRLAFFAAAERRDLFSVPEIIDWLLSDDRWWLWATETQHEVIRLLVALVRDLAEIDAERLQAAILDGLPDDMKSLAADPEQIERIQNREIWRRLSVLRAAGFMLNNAASQKLAGLLEEHPTWGEVEEKDKFPVWMGSDGSWRRYSATPKSRRDLEGWLRENPSVDDAHQEDDFRERCRTDFPRVIVALLNLARNGEWPTDRWRQALNAWSEESFAPRAWRCLHGPLSNAPEAVFERLVRPVAQLLKAIAKKVGMHPDVFFALSRRVIEGCRNDTQESGNDLLTAAINHPVGDTTEAILDWWYARGLEDNQKLDGQMLEILTDLTDLNVPSFRHARILLGVHAITLFRVDREWTSLHLLPLFDWQRHDLAFAAWSGFLWSPRLYWPLLIALQEPFLATAQHYEELGDLGDQYVALLVFAALDRDPSFKVSKFSEALAILPSRGLSRAARALTDGLQGAGERRSEYWENRVKPFIKSVWPKSQQARTAQVSEKFSELVIAADDAFPDAMRTLGAWLLPTEEWSYILHELAESQLCTRFPDEALEFISRIVPDNPVWSRDELKSSLVAIRAAAPSLVADHRFGRLEIVIRQGGSSLD